MSDFWFEVQCPQFCIEESILAETAEDAAERAVEEMWQAHQYDVVSVRVAPMDDDGEEVVGPWQEFDVEIEREIHTSATRREDREVA